jgi:Tol biopolymer transport system component
MCGDGRPWYPLDHALGPSWSPNGRPHAFTSIRTGLSQVYRMRRDGSGQRPLTNALGNCDSPAWSPREQ